MAGILKQKSNSAEPHRERARLLKPPEMRRRGDCAFLEISAHRLCTPRGAKANAVLNRLPHLAHHIMLSAASIVPRSKSGRNRLRCRKFLKEAPRR